MMPLPPQSGLRLAPYDKERCLLLPPGDDVCPKEDAWR
jgi:hypothetical protein